MRRYVFDPGHGGLQRVGTSTAIGVRGPAGTAEKDVTLLVARALERHLPGAVLTRTDDRNLTLGGGIAAADPTAFLDGNRVAVTFQSADGRLHLAQLTGGAWTCEEIVPAETPPA